MYYSFTEQWQKYTEFIQEVLDPNKTCDLFRVP